MTRKFEAWALKRGLNLTVDGHGLYQHIETVWAWAGWDSASSQPSAYFAQELALRFVKDGAKNFITDLHTITPVDGSPAFEVTVKIQPIDAMTPEQLLANALAEIAELKTRLDQ